MSDVIKMIGLLSLSSLLNVTAFANTNPAHAVLDKNLGMHYGKLSSTAAYMANPLKGECTVRIAHAEFDRSPGSHFYYVFFANERVTDLEDYRINFGTAEKMYESLEMKLSPDGQKIHAFERPYAEPKYTLNLGGNNEVWSITFKDPSGRNVVCELN